MTEKHALDGAFPVNIFLVEDDLGDAKAIRRAFQKAGAANSFILARNGEEALQILQTADGCGQDRNLILLDLNMPRMNGLEFLEALRNDANLKSTVVFVLTTSDDRRDVEAAFRFNVAGYFLKSNEQSYQDVIETLTKYWNTSLLPAFPNLKKSEVDA